MSQNQLALKKWWIKKSVEVGQFLISLHSAILKTTISWFILLKPIFYYSEDAQLFQFYLHITCV